MNAAWPVSNVIGLPRYFSRPRSQFASAIHLTQLLQDIPVLNSDIKLRLFFCTSKEKKKRKKIYSKEPISSYACFPSPIFGSPNSPTPNTSTQNLTTAALCLQAPYPCSPPLVRVLAPVAIQRNTSRGRSSNVSAPPSNKPSVTRPALAGQSPNLRKPPKTRLWATFQPLGQL